MPADQARTLVRHYFEQIHNRNLAVLDELLAPNYVDHTPLPFPVPAGRDGTRQVAHAALRATPDGWHHILGQVADGDLVLTMIEAGGTFQEALFDLKPTGQPISMRGMSLHRVSDGRLVEHWAISDFVSLFQQIGLMPAADQPPSPAPAAGPPRTGRAPTRDEARQLMQRFGDMLNRQDYSAIDEIVAPDFSADFIGLPPMTDRATWLAMVQGFLAGFSGFSLTPEHELYDGEWFGGNWTWTATHTDPFMGIQPTGRQVQVRGLGMYRILDGRIVEERVIEDLLGLLVQLGVVPAPPGQTVPA